MGYHFLTSEERYTIEVMLKNNHSIREIARELGRDRRTIQREINRGKVDQMDSRTRKVSPQYKYDYAHREACSRLATRGAHLKLEYDFETRIVISNLIKDNHWSPAAAVHYVLRNNLVKTSISTPTVYRYIYNGLMPISEHDLPFGRAKLKAANERYKHAHANTLGTSIEQRPEEVKLRVIPFHWEGDLIVGGRGTSVCYLTLVERKTRFCIAKRLENKEAATVVAALDELEAAYGTKFKQIFQSITFDNGREFASFKEMETSRYECRKGEKRTQIFFAHPYSSYERGSNENCNRLLRRAGFTKGSNLGSISQRQALRQIAWVNNLPRKILDWKSAQEAFEEELALIT